MTEQQVEVGKQLLYIIKEFERVLNYFKRAEKYTSEEYRKHFEEFFNKNNLGNSETNHLIVKTIRDSIPVRLEEKINELKERLEKL